MPPSSLETNPTRRSSNPAAAYLRHLQQKQQNQQQQECDHRQTIVSPVVKENKLLLEHSLNSSAIETGSFFSSMSTSNSTTTTATASLSSSSIGSSNPLPYQHQHPQQHHERKKKAKKKKSSRNKESGVAKPPLCSKQTRSVISENSNSTYFSSDSEEEVEADAGTVLSEEFTVGSGSVHSGISNQRPSLPLKSSPRNGSPTQHKRSSTENVSTIEDDHSSAALVIYQPKQASKKASNKTNRSSGAQKNKPYYLKNIPPEDQDELGFLQYSDGEEEEHYLPEISSYAENNIQRDDDDDDDDEVATTNTDDDTLADLDQLIAESSKRWKDTVHSTVQNTVTAKTISAPLSILDSLQTQMSLTHLQSQHHHSPHYPMPHRHHHQQQHPQTGMLVEVADDAVDDDLTVWSGFHSTVHRPDAASVVVHEPSPPPSALNRKSVPGTTKVVSGLTLELQSSMSGVTRRAVFSGTLRSDYNNNARINGTGTLEFVETGDVYHGSIVDSEMHGLGTYTFANGKTLEGSFQRNVFVG